MTSKTDLYRTAAILTGILFLTTDITAIVGLQLYQPLLTNPQFITSVAANDTRILIGTFLETILAFCNVGTAIVLYPILKRQHQGMALGYVVLRAMEATFILIGVISILAVLSLRLDFLATGGDPLTYQSVGKALVALQKWTFLFGPNIILPVNATILGYLLYKSGLVPRAISALYLFDGPILFVSSIFILFGFYETMSAPAILVAMPMLVFEVLFSIWLMIRGFDRAALESLTARS